MNKIYKLSLIILLLLIALNVSAQKDAAVEAADVKDEIAEKLIELPDSAVWDWGGNGAIQFGQTALVNWAAGGNSQIAATTHLFLFANLTKKKHLWENSFDGNWGIVKFKGEGPQINQNLMTLNSQYGYNIAKNTFISGMLNVQTAITKGFDYDETPKKLITRFAAPMYIKLALGIHYKPKPCFSVFVSPLAGKFTIVGDENIAALDRYIPATLDENGDRYYNNNFRAELGALARITFQKEIVKNVSVRSIAEFFVNYSDPNKDNRKNIDVDWQTGIDLKVNEWLAVNLFMHLIYDHNTNWDKLDGNGDPVFLRNPDTGALYEDVDGNFIQQKTTGVQFRQALTVGVTYNFGKGVQKEKREKRAQKKNK